MLYCRLGYFVIDLLYYCLYEGVANLVVQQPLFGDLKGQFVILTNWNASSVAPLSS